MTPSSPSQEQVRLAGLLGINIASDSFDVAAARLQDAVASAIGYEPAEQSSERQRAFASSLGGDVSSDSKRVASAKIGEALFARNLDAIVELNLQPGDRVVRVTEFEIEGELKSFKKSVRGFVHPAELPRVLQRRQRPRRMANSASKGSGLTRRST